jgi:hypothetical protein
MDREGISGLAGRKVAVRLNSVEAMGVELVAMLDEVREDGVVLSEIGELGQGQNRVGPWESLHRVRPGERLRMRVMPRLLRDARPVH